MRTPCSTAGTLCRLIFSLQSLALLALITPAAETHGQTWKYEYGVVGNPPNSSEAGFNRVAPVTGSCRSYPSCNACSTQSNGYIAVGRSTTMTSDVYIVRTDNSGAAIWERTYDVTGNGYYDVGYSIIELSNGSGFVVTGWTQSTSGTRAFLMKVDCDGDPVWTNVYNPPSSQGYYQAWGYDLVEARTGNGTTTNVGDIIVCGHLVQDREISADALIFRTNSTGGLIWNAAYNNGTANGYGTDERLEKLVEANRRGGQTAGDIIAVGATGPFTGQKDGYVLRVNGNDGSIGAAPQGAAAYGNTAYNYFYGVVELQNPAERGTSGPNVVLAGTHNEGTTAGGMELYFVKLNNGDPCDPALETIVGDRTTGYPDIAYDIREIRFPFGTSGGGPGGGNEAEMWDLLVTGETGALTASNNRDAILLDLDVASLTPNFGVVHRTSTQVGASEWGRSLEVVNSIGNRTLGVILCGEVQGAEFRSELFLVKTDVSLSTEGDCQEDFNPGYAEVDLYQGCSDPTISDPLLEDDVTSGDTERDWGTEVCIAIIKSVPHIGSASGNASSDAEAYSVRVVPNPVRAGREVVLQFEGGTLPERVNVDVVNAAGESVAVASGVSIEEGGAVRLQAAAWPAGVYFITVTDGRYRRMLRVVVE